MQSPVVAVEPDGQAPAMRNRALLGLLLAGCGGGADFYQPPDRLPSAPMGALLKVEEREPFAPGSRAYRVLYLSTGIHGEPVAVSGLVGVPDGAPPAAGFDVVSWAHGTTGIADACAPSTGRRFNHDAYDVAPDVLAEGWVFVATDYEGLGTPGMHRYLVGDSEARSILDSVRAAGFLPGVTLSRKVVLLGRSQGGHAALFGGELAPSYAPELDVRGVLAGAPASDLLSAFGVSGFLQGRTGAYNWCMGYSFADAYGMDIARLYDDYTRSFVDPALAGGACLNELSDLSVELGSAGLDVTVLEDAGFRAYVDGNSPGHRRQPAPVRIHQGLADQDVPPVATQLLVDAMCAAGDPVFYATFPGENHPDSTSLHEAEMMAFARERFAGTTFTSNCP